MEINKRDFFRPAASLMTAVSASRAQSTRPGPVCKTYNVRFLHIGSSDDPANPFFASAVIPG